VGERPGLVRKIPTLFKRDPDDMKHVLPEVTPGCEWVLEGEGTATRKYDGTCVMFDGDYWWTRRELRPSAESPEGFLWADFDEVTGKTVGWMPEASSGFSKYLHEALALGAGAGNEWPEGTYELCGPKVNGNPEGLAWHRLVRHAAAERYPAMNAPLGCDELRRALTALPWEGLVWYHPDGRRAKLKRRDFRE
jgi:hypothetical protein